MPTPQSSGADSSARQHIYDVFLSHHSGDKQQVEALTARLEDEEGLKPFLDKWHLIPGAPWQEAIEDEGSTFGAHVSQSRLRSALVVAQIVGEVSASRFAEASRTSLSR